MHKQVGERGFALWACDVLLGACPLEDTVQTAAGRHQPEEDLSHGVSCVVARWRESGYALRASWSFHPSTSMRVDVIDAH